MDERIASILVREACIIKGAQLGACVEASVGARTLPRGTIVVFKQLIFIERLPDPRAQSHSKQAV
jgi:hypothetical protein